MQGVQQGQQNVQGMPQGPAWFGAQWIPQQQQGFASSTTGCVSGAGTTGCVPGAWCGTTGCVSGAGCNTTGFVPGVGTTGCVPGAGFGTTGCVPGAHGTTGCVPGASSERLSGGLIFQISGWQNPSGRSRKPSPAIILFYALGTEDLVSSTDPLLTVILGSFLIQAWTGLRWAHLQRVSPINVIFDFDTLRGIAWRTKTTTRGQAFGCVASGFLSHGSQSWLLVYLRALDNILVSMEPATWFYCPQDHRGLEQASTGPTAGTYALCRCILFFAGGHLDPLEAKFICLWNSELHNPWAEGIAPFLVLCLTRLSETFQIPQISSSVGITEAYP